MDSDWKLKDHLPLDGPSETFSMPNQISCSCSHRHAGDYMEIEDFGELFRLHKQKGLLSQDYENRVGLFSVERHEVDSRLVKASNSIGLDRSRGMRPTLHSTCFRWQMLQQTGCCLQGRFTWIFIVTLKKDDHKKRLTSQFVKRSNGNDKIATHRCGAASQWGFLIPERRHDEYISYGEFCSAAVLPVIIQAAWH